MANTMIKKAIDEHEGRKPKQAEAIMNIAQETELLARNTLTGFTQISDEMYRNRLQGEKFWLSKQIDLLENQITSNGGNLEIIYNKFQANKKPYITLSLMERRIMVNLCDKKVVEEAKRTIKSFMINPFKNLVQTYLLPLHCKIQIKSNGQIFLVRERDKLFEPVERNFWEYKSVVKLFWHYTALGNFKTLDNGTLHFVAEGEEFPCLRVKNSSYFT